MLIKRSFVIIIMVDTIYSTSSQSSFKFPPTFGIVHHVLLQHLDFYSNHAMFFSTQVLGGIHENFISTSFCALYIYVCVYLFLLDQFLPLTSFNLFVQQNLLWIYTLTTPNVTILYVTIIVMPVCMASYMTTSYGHANHAFKVNVRSQVTVRYQVFQGYGLFRVSALLTVV